jgi:cysteinyl-tRNA synthetase
MQKRLELQNLLIQPTPEQKAVMAKQKEINDLISKLSEKRTAYELETKKLFPSGSAPGFATPYRGYGYCPGPGYGYGKGWGTTGLGPRGGPCW